MDSKTQVTTDQSPTIHPYFTTLAAQGNEDAIAHDIELLWLAHRAMQITVTDYRQELRLLGQTLGEALFFMKILLARPGRNGKWSEFLREKKISRTSGDRLVHAYERSLHPAASRTHGAIPCPHLKKRHPAKLPINCPPLLSSNKPPDKPATPRKQAMNQSL
jgi:hypothetical protein